MTSLISLSAAVATVVVAPLIRSRLWHFINLFTYLLTYLVVVVVVVVAAAAAAAVTAI